MNIRSISNYLLTVALALSSAAALAGPVYKFELTGAYAATWQLTTPVVPDDSFAGQQFTIWNVVGTFENASTSMVDLTFFSSADGGGLNIYDFAAHTNLLSTDGPQLYTGAEGAPAILSGTFNLTQFQGVGQYTLTVTEVTAIPEPATMLLTCCGLLIVTTVARRKRPAGAAERDFRSL